MGTPEWRDTTASHHPWADRALLYEGKMMESQSLKEVSTSSKLGEGTKASPNPKLSTKPDGIQQGGRPLQRGGADAQQQEVGSKFTPGSVQQGSLPQGSGETQQGAPSSVSGSVGQGGPRASGSGHL
ncbi:hypothetical protein H0H87_009900 [Tephrocybe sp. NHM501043]|nr:hypothetical protein H0H87_009900 [Tephrocybe sp. NHM501043]